MRSPRLVAAAALIAAAAALTGCVAMPTDGGVERGVDVAPPDSGLDLFAPGPEADAEPAQIVDGFLLASSTGLGDDFAGAREFLTAVEAESWQPQGVAVYSSAEALTTTAQQVPGDPNRMTVTVEAPVVATIDGAGSYTEVPGDTLQSFAFELTRDVEDQWRISALEPGVLMSQVTFGNQYTEASVYFLSTDEPRRLVPDPRFVPFSGAPRAVVRALLAGPSEWLRPGVITAFPDGTQLAIEGVEVDDRLATVALTAEIQGASAPLRALARAQLEATLGQLQQVSRVEMSVDGTLISVDADLADLADTPILSRAPTLLTPDGLAQLGGDAASLLDGAVPQPAGVTAITVPYDDGPVLGLLERGTLVAVATAEAEQLQLYAPGGPLLDPSYDVDGWAWTGPAGVSDGVLVAVDPVAGTTAEVSAPGLAGADVVAIRLAREGARIAYAVRTDDAVAVYVAAVTRDADGRPTAVGPGLQIGPSFTELRDLVWVDETHLAALAAVDRTVTVVVTGVGGPTQSLPSVADPVAVAAGDGVRELYVATSTADLYGRSGNGWRQISPDAIDALDVTFAG